VPVSSNDANAISSPYLTEKALLVLSARAADGLLGEFAAGVGAAAAGLRISGRHDAFQFSPYYYSILEPSIFAEWGLNQSEYSSWGVPRKKSVSRQAFAGQR
jgi:hypothetical protein